MTDHLKTGGGCYPVRELRLSDYEVDVRVSSESLRETLYDSDGNYTSREAQLIDELIFFYVPDDLITDGTDEEVEQYVIDNLDWEGTVPARNG